LVREYEIGRLKMDIVIATHHPAMIGHPVGAHLMDA
jgi:hypothetical protein